MRQAMHVGNVPHFQINANTDLSNTRRCTAITLELIVCIIFPSRAEITSQVCIFFRTCFLFFCATFKIWAVKQILCADYWHPNTGFIFFSVHRLYTGGQYLYIRFTQMLDLIFFLFYCLFVFSSYDAANLLGSSTMLHPAMDSQLCSWGSELV